MKGRDFDSEKRDWRTQRIDETEVVRIQRRDEYSDDGYEDYDDDFDEPPFDPDETDADYRRAGERGDTDLDTPVDDEAPRRERFKLIKQIFLGTILNQDYIRENYRYAFLIAGMLFLSIVMLFSSLGAYIRYTNLDNEVRLLRERAIRMSEMRYEQSSHSAIVRRIKERGIDLADPVEQRELLD